MRIASSSEIRVADICVGSARGGDTTGGEGFCWAVATVAMLSAVAANAITVLILSIPRDAPAIGTNSCVKGKYRKEDYLKASEGLEEQSGAENF
jgi:hypothetical protein